MQSLEDEFGHVEAALDELRDRGTVRDSRAVILVAGDSMQLVDASQGACELLGYERAELLALSVRDIAVDRAQLERLHTEFLRDGQQSGSVVLHRKDGSSVEAVYYGFTRRREFHVAVLFPL